MKIIYQKQQKYDANFQLGKNKFIHYAISKKSTKNIDKKDWSCSMFDN